MKKVAIILFLVGLSFVFYAGVQLKSNKQSEKTALVHAHKILESSDITKPPSHLSFQSGQTIGVLQIPTIGKELPIVEGIDEDALKNGVGHYTGTVYPGQKDQILLSGHRDTVFTGLDKLKTGDPIIVEMQHGSFTYGVKDTAIVDGNDTSIIHSTAPNEMLILSTCYPFRYIGNAPQRFIIYAEPMGDFE
ncbi:class D sortase [Sporosarcina oncorhynchi]|uniref:Class D sortase n=1 Tax=Sporosarcina oncorhynchi TaxID=3056444 RepID=A0ABZ0L9A7_9BACL|nr:class D sortase [Sporosarcina sp. T2O-4]WOV89124.1 class D sortase [Sporosarcina sp. T2O-4]